jgi:DNA repair exonuclease SbcCD ATPase subunit
LEDIEKLAKELIALAEKVRLSEPDHERVKSLMAELRRKGMSNEEISEITEGRWKESTIRGYTKGIKTENPEGWNKATQLLNEVISRGIPLEDLEIARKVIEKLESKGIRLDDMTDLLSNLKGEGIGIEEFLTCYREQKDANLTTQDIREMMEYRFDLEDMGFTTDKLSLIVSEAKKVGSPDAVLEEIVAYKELKEIESKTDKAKKELEELEAKKDRELEDLEDKRNSLNKELAELGKELSKAKTTLERYEKLEKLGYDLNALEEIAKSAGKFKDVLKAINAYKTLSEMENGIKKARDEHERLKSELEELNKEYAKSLEICITLEKHGLDLPALKGLSKSLENYKPSEFFEAINRCKSLKGLEEKLKEKRKELKDAELKIRKTMQKYSHLTDVTGVCDKLLNKKFGLDAIEDLYKLSGKYGSPLEVLKAVEKYGKMEEVENKIKEKWKEKSGIEAEIDSLKKVKEKSQALIKQQYKQMEELNALSVKIGKKVGKIEGKLKGDEKAVKILEFIEEPASFSKKDVATLIAPIIDATKTWIEVNEEVSYPSLAKGHAKDLAKSLRE